VDYADTDVPGGLEWLGFGLRSQPGAYVKKERI
jgi:hypothetical protein